MNYYNTPTTISSSLSKKNQDSSQFNLIKYNEKIIATEKQAILYYIDKYKMDFKTTPKGIYYHIVNSGKGKLPKTGNKIVIEYQFYFLNETLAYQSNAPTTITVGGTDIISGIDDGIKLIRPGGKIKLIVPFNWAYGVAGKLPAIPPYTPLLCDIDFIGYE